MLKSYMRRKSALVAVFMVIAILFASMIPMMSWAEETPGQKPLNFVGAYLTEMSNNTSTTGADIKTTSVSVKPTIKVVFDKNIVNDAVWENNKKCVSLQDSSGINVATNVFRVSDAVNFNERQNIFMTPMKDLNPGAHYKIIIRPDLRAKNGYSNLGMTTSNQPVIVNFTVKVAPTQNKSIDQLAYHVKSGDTLWKIAQRYRTTTNGIITANHIIFNHYLIIGEKLLIPVHLTTYTVKVGDTLWSIAQKYGTTVGNLLRLNKMSTNQYLYVGQKVKVNY
jgi:LysM repeat protein